MYLVLQPRTPSRRLERAGGEGKAARAGSPSKQRGEGVGGFTPSPAGEVGGTPGVFTVWTCDQAKRCRTATASRPHVRPRGWGKDKVAPLSASAFTVFGFLSRHKCMGYCGSARSLCFRTRTLTIHLGRGREGGR